MFDTVSHDIWYVMINSIKQLSQVNEYMYNSIDKSLGLVDVKRPIMKLSLLIKN